VSNITRRSEPTSRAILGDDLSIEEKFQSNTEIACFPRNSFWASLERQTLEVEHWMELDGFGLLVPIKLRILELLVRESDGGS
jgi:hypothetical protein